MRLAGWVAGSLALHAALAAALAMRFAPPPPAPPPLNAVEVVMVRQAAADAGEARPAAPDAPQDGEAAPPPRAAYAIQLGPQASEPWRVLSDDISPPSPDARWRNLPPRYPLDAAARGESGTVGIVVHVATDGTALGADIALSSGSARLDREARRAVMLWHFQPALLNGQPTPFDYPISIKFTPRGAER